VFSADEEARRLAQQEVERHTERVAPVH